MSSGTEEQQGTSASEDRGHDGHLRSMYLRFAAMIGTAMVAMYATMFVGAYEWDHVTFSESRVYMP
jgi:hypothetical protein